MKSHIYLIETEIDISLRIKVDMSWMPKKVVIYSVGLLGGSFGLALRTSGFKGSIIGLSSPKSIEQAIALGCIDEGFTYDRLADAIKGADLLVLCSPINAIKKTIEALGAIELPENLVITDVGSTKEEIVATAIKYLPKSVSFIGGHPMAGSEKSGPGASDPYLFQNAMYVVTPPDGTIRSIDKEFIEFISYYLGCRNLVLDPSFHDTIAASVSHVPHLLAVALVCVAHDTENKIPGTLELAAGGFRDMTRIASASYEMWHDILNTNKKEIAPLLDNMITYLQDIKSKLQNDQVGPLFNRAKDVRLRIPSSNKGFITRLSEILVVVKDQPGIIASIASLLASQNINIKDIEVLKVREGEGGTLRLAFENDAVARSAILLLEKNGFIARERK